MGASCGKSGLAKEGERETSVRWQDFQSNVSVLQHNLSGEYVIVDNAVLAEIQELWGPAWVLLRPSVVQARADNMPSSRLMGVPLGGGNTSTTEVPERRDSRLKQPSPGDLPGGTCAMAPSAPHSLHPVSAQAMQGPLTGDLGPRCRVCHRIMANTQVLQEHLAACCLLAEAQVELDSADAALVELQQSLHSYLDDSMKAAVNAGKSHYHKDRNKLPH